MAKLFWNKCLGEIWCPLNTVNIQHSHFDNMNGVYIIWHGGTDAKTVKVGKGFIRDAINVNRSDKDVQNYASNILYVTWARVEENQVDGVLKFLVEKLKPSIPSDEIPQVDKIDVNVPW